MSQLAPPPLPPRVAVNEDDNAKRLRFRLWQVLMTTFTILLTVWFITLGPIPAIIALVVCKHILVAILCMGLDLYPTYKGEKPVGPR
jgi:uncharacterized membrane protein